MPNAPSESLEKNFSFIFFHFLCKFCLRTPSVSNGQYGRTKDLARQSPDPTVCATPPTVSHRAQSPQSSKCEVLERLQRPAHRAQGPQSSKCEVLERLQRPVWQNHWQGSRGLRGLKRPVWQKKLFFPFLRTSWPRTPAAATAFPHLILVQNEPLMVALSMPNAP